MENKEISQMRSEIIERFISIEQLVDIIISYHYFGYLNLDFVSQVLYDDSANFGLKCRIIEKTTNADIKKIKDLYRLNKIRNIFAHSNHAMLRKDGEDSEKEGATGKGNNAEVFYNPRAIGEKMDFVKLHEEFTKKADEALPYLLELLKSKEADIPASLMVFKEDFRKQLFEMLKKGRPRIIEE